MLEILVYIFLRESTGIVVGMMFIVVFATLPLLLWLPYSCFEKGEA